jgi:hypothetical protein
VYDGERLSPTETPAEVCQSFHLCLLAPSDAYSSVVFSGQWRTGTSLTRFCSRYVLILSLTLSAHAHACVARRQLSVIYLHLNWGVKSNFHQHCVSSFPFCVVSITRLSSAQATFVLLNSVPKLTTSSEIVSTYVAYRCRVEQPETQRPELEAHYSLYLPLRTENTKEKGFLVGQRVGL